MSIKEITLPLDRVALGKRLRQGVGSHKRYGDAPSKGFFKSCTSGVPFPDVAFIIYYLDFGHVDVSAFGFRPQTLSRSAFFDSLCDAIDKGEIAVTKCKNGIPLLNRSDVVSFVQAAYPNYKSYLPWLSEGTAVNHLATQARTKKKQEFLEVARRITVADVELHGEFTPALRVSSIIKGVYKIKGWPLQNGNGSPKSFSAEHRWLKEANLRRNAAPGVEDSDNGERTRIKAIMQRLFGSAIAPNLA